MAKHEELLAPNTALEAGEPTPPTTEHKAYAALWGLIPIILGAVVEMLQQADTLFPDAPPWVLNVVAVVLIILGPVVSYLRVQATPNLLKQPVVVDPQPEAGNPV
jgi:hypothetical protein